MKLGSELAELWTYEKFLSPRVPVNVVCGRKSRFDFADTNLKTTLRRRSPLRVITIATTEDQKNGNFLIAHADV